MLCNVLCIQVRQLLAAVQMQLFMFVMLHYVYSLLLITNIMVIIIIIVIIIIVWDVLGNEQWHWHLLYHLLLNVSDLYILAIPIHALSYLLLIHLYFPALNIIIIIINIIINIIGSSIKFIAKHYIALWLTLFALFAVCLLLFASQPVAVEYHTIANTQLMPFLVAIFIIIFILNMLRNVFFFRYLPT